MAEKGSRATILWDLDDTIGDFRGMRITDPELGEPIKLRYGIHELLNEFSADAGYQHFITSSANPGYIGEALRKTYLDGKFTRTFGNDTVNQSLNGKHYLPVAQGVSQDEMREKMIVIGDANTDKPVDIGGMVFVELGNPEEPLEALVIREILTTVLSEGDGNFKSGYEKLYERAQPIESDDPDKPERRILNIGNDIEFAMEYRIAEEVKDVDQQKVPVICNIKADSHKKPFQPFF